LEGAAAPEADSAQFSAVCRVDFAGRRGGTERYRLTDAHDIRDVVAWADTQSEGRTYEI
jgi:hypothetical protein